MNVNQAAFITTTSLAAVTVGATIAAASATASTVAIVAYAILAITGAAASLASISAWVHTNAAENTDKSAGKYFENMKSHLCITLPATCQFVAQVLVQALVQGISQGVSRNAARRIGGADFTYQEMKG